MHSDLDLIKHEFDREIKIIPISDVHLGALEHDKAAWLQFCKTVEKEENTYLMLNGDLINNSIRTSVANPFDEVLRPREQKQRMVEHLTPLKGKILCLVSGNHERRSMKDSDVDITYDIASKLDIEDVYRENIAFLKIKIGKRSNADKSACAYSFAVTHGAGGGIYTGAAVNRNERFGGIVDGLDCMIVGHTHKGAITRPSKIVFDMKNEKVTMKDFLVVSSPSWLNYGGYAMQKMLLPSAASIPQKLLLNGVQNRKKIEVIW